MPSCEDKETNCPVELPHPLTPKKLKLAKLPDV